MTHDPRAALEELLSANEEVDRTAGALGLDARNAALARQEVAEQKAREALTASAPKGEPCADWSDLPKDIYVIGAQRVDAVGYDVQCCSVPMVAVPEVRYVRADMVTALYPAGGDGHDSDCATHNEPAYPNGPCNCSAAVGDEAKKSAPVRAPSLPSGESDLSVTTGCAGAGTPSDPPERREIVQPHDWIKSTLGHGEVMCSRCCITNREAAVLGRLNVCSRPAGRSALAQSEDARKKGG